MAQWKFPIRDEAQGGGPLTDAEVKAFGDNYKSLSQAYVNNETTDNTALKDAMFVVLEAGGAKDEQGNLVKKDPRQPHNVNFSNGGNRRILHIVQPQGGFGDPGYLKEFVKYCQLPETSVTLDEKCKALHGMMLISKCR